MKIKFDRTLPGIWAYKVPEKGSEVSFALYLSTTDPKEGGPISIVARPFTAGDTTGRFMRVTNPRYEYANDHKDFKAKAEAFFAEGKDDADSE